MKRTITKEYKAVWIDNKIMIRIKKKLATLGKVTSICKYVENLILSDLSKK